MREFWEQVAEAAARVLSCPTCQASAAGPTSGRHPGEWGLPQPGWVGPQFQPGTGVVIVLRNPAVADDSYGTTREQHAQRRLRLFAQAPTVEAYRQFVQESIRDVVGDPAAGKRPWRKWTHPVSKVVDGYLHPQQLAWLNVVRHRTPASGSTGRKDAPVSDAAIAHGIGSPPAPRTGAVAARGGRQHRLGRPRCSRGDPGKLEAVLPEAARRQ